MLPTIGAMCANYWDQVLPLSILCNQILIISHCSLTPDLSPCNCKLETKLQIWPTMKTKKKYVPTLGHCNMRNQMEIVCKAIHLARKREANRTITKELNAALTQPYKPCSSKKSSPVWQKEKLTFLSLKIHPSVFLNIWSQRTETS